MNTETTCDGSFSVTSGGFALSSGAAQSSGHDLYGGFVLSSGSALSYGVSAASMGLLARTCSRGGVILNNGRHVAAAAMLACAVQMADLPAWAVIYNIPGGSGIPGESTSANVTLYAGDVMNVNYGGTVTSTSIISGGIQNVYNGGIATSSTIYSGGEMVVSGGTTSNATVYGGQQVVCSGGSATSTTIFGGEQVVQDGGTVNQVTLAGGSCFLHSDAIARGTLQGYGSVSMDYDTITLAGAHNFTSWLVSNGSLRTPNNLQINSNGGVTVNSGGVLEASDVMVADGGALTISGGGVFSATSINATGEATISLSGGMLLATGGIELQGALTGAAGTVAAGTSLSLAGANMSSDRALNLSAGTTIAASGPISVASLHAASVDANGDVTVESGKINLTDGGSAGRKFVAHNATGTLGDLAAKDIVIDDGSVLYASSLTANDCIDISDAIVKVDATKTGQPALRAKNGIEIADGFAILMPAGSGVGNDGEWQVVKDSSNEVAKRVMIGPSVLKGKGTVTTPKTLKEGQKATWKAAAEKGSVFSCWEGTFVDSLGLSRNQLRNPSLQFVVPKGFDTNNIHAVFVSLCYDRLGSLALSKSGPLAPNEEVADLALVDDSESYVTASVSGLPTGLKFDAKTLAITGKPTKPGVYTVKITAKNASGYQWAENVELRVADISDTHINFSGLPKTGTVGTNYTGRVDAGEFKSLSASGLPTGLKFNTKNGEVTGKPTKGGYFMVTVTANYPDKTKAIATQLLTISPVPAVEPKRTAHYPLMVVSLDSSKGTVTGTGVYAAGKKASISAKPAKGYVFAGWYVNPAMTVPMSFASGDFRNPSQSVVISEERYLFARFLDPVEEEIALAIGDEDMTSSPDGSPVNPARTNYCGVAVNWPLEVTADSLPAVKATGLPTGVKLVQDKKTGAYSLEGTPTAASKKDKGGNLTPATVKLTVTTASKSPKTYAFNWTIRPLPDWAVGTFDGVVSNGKNDEPVGLVQSLTVAANGKISGKLQKGGLTWTLSAPSFSEGDDSVFSATVVGKSGKLVETNDVTVAMDEKALSASEPYSRGIVSGQATIDPSLEWTAWQNLWKQDDWKTVAKPFANKKLALCFADDKYTRLVAPDTLAEDAEVYGTLDLKFASSGAVTASGKFVTGQNKNGKNIVYSATCSSVLIPSIDGTYGNYSLSTIHYSVFLYFPPKAGKFDGYAVEIPLVWENGNFSTNEQ